jgi:hypothetical protein
MSDLKTRIYFIIFQILNQLEQLVQGLGHHANPSENLSVVVQNSQCQTISTLSSGMSNLFRGVQELVEMQKKQTEAIDRGFNRLIQVLSQRAPLALSSLSPLRNDVADETFESVMDPVETPILVELIRTNHTTNTYELPSVQRIFDELGGKAQKRRG